jgi:hypothetical protein
MGTMARKKPTIKLAKLTVFGRRNGELVHSFVTVKHKDADPSSCVRELWDDPNAEILFVARGYVDVVQQGDMSKMSLNLSPEVLAGLQAESRRRGVGIPTVIRDALSKAMEKQPPQDGTGGKP